MSRSSSLTQDNYAWYRRYPSRALSGMRGLNPEQRGVYGTIIDLCYDRRGPLADDDVTLARECECDIRRYRRIKAELLDKERIVVDKEAGTIYDERAVRELVAAQMFSESQAKRARSANKKSTSAQKPTQTQDRSNDKPEVLQKLQDLDQTVGPKSPPQSLKDNDKAAANRVREEIESSLVPALPAQAPPPSPLIGGGGALGRSARKPNPEREERKRRMREAEATAAALRAAKREVRP